MSRKLSYLFLLLIVVLSGCGAKEKDPVEDKIKVGVMLSENGLGDQSFSDLAFAGLVKARDEKDVIIEYLELAKTESYEKGFEELAKNNNDIVFALGFTGQEALETVAAKFPDQQFVIVDAVSDMKNITSITFKEDEGSILAGIVAATVSKSQTIGFIGGVEAPVIQRFEKGFREGAQLVNPDITFFTKYTNDFDDDALGASIASEMIDNEADVLYAAAGFAGIGMLKEAEKRNVYAIGVDSDQYFFAEKAVITSMMKNIDIALYDVISQYKESGKIPTGHLELGLAENGVGLAPFRAWDLTETQQDALKVELEKAESQMK